MAKITSKNTAGSSASNLLVLLASALFAVGAFELFLTLENRRPALEPASLELGGRQFDFVERPQALSRLDDAAAVVGDSFTAGVACGIGRNYPSHLGRLVAGERDLQRVVNLGVSGADPFMYLQLVEGLLTSGRVPSALVVTLYSNDIELTCSACNFLERIRHDAAFSAAEIARLESFCRNCIKSQNSRRGHYSPVRQLHIWLNRNLHVYGLLRDGLVRLSMNLGYNVGWGRTAYLPLWQDPGSTEFKLLRLALAGMRDASKGAGVGRMMVVIYPDVVNIRHDNVYVEIYREAERSLAGALGVPVFSGYPAFLDHPEARPSMSYSLTDHHPNCKAHELFAQWVSGKLRGIGEGPALLRTGRAP